MIREYQIINVELHQADEDDEEVIATVRDVISCDEFYVVINDYFLEHYPEHLWDTFNKLQKNDRIKGELVLINCQITELMSSCYFSQKGYLVDLHLLFQKSSIKSAGFTGQFEVLKTDDSIPISVKYPYGTYDIRVDKNRLLKVESKEIGLRGELYLETIGGIIRE
jgi:hypothetical protein